METNDKTNDKTTPKSMWIADLGDGTYRNPILYTDYSDPDAIRVGEDFFMIASSFCNSPAVPILHSKDLVNWKVINYVWDKLPFDTYEKPMHGCGAWAPSIRYHEGIYYCFIPMPDEGIFMSKTTDPWGKWSEPICVKKACGWIDPCPFWDDDGKVYMVSAFARSRIGFKSRLYLTQLTEDLSDTIDDGKFVFDGYETQPTIEGPKLYKRNGYYYIFAPAGGVATGWQTALRSKNIYGPYEERIVLRQGNTEVNGPHQGAWVDTPSGEDWFLHFQDVGNAGRIIHLEPMYWENDWPVIGVNEKDGCGEPALVHKKPDVGAVYEVEAPDDSDFFEAEKLGLQWQWNANYDAQWYRMEQPGIRLFVQPKAAKTQLCNVKNLFLQKWPAPEFTIETALDLRDLKNGDFAGMVCLGGEYSSIMVHKMEDAFYLKQRTGSWAEEVETRAGFQRVVCDRIIFRERVEESKFVSFSYSTNGKTFSPIGCVVETSPGRWVGVKDGLFAFREEDGEGGSVKVEYFIYMK